MGEIGAELVPGVDGGLGAGRAEKGDVLLSDVMDS